MLALEFRLGSGYCTRRPPAMPAYDLLAASAVHRQACDLDRRKKEFSELVADENESYCRTLVLHCLQLERS